MHLNPKRFSRMALLQSLGAGTLVALLCPRCPGPGKSPSDSRLRASPVLGTRRSRRARGGRPASRGTLFRTGRTLQLRDYSWLGGAVQVEASRTNIDGSYKRPKVIVGLPSESMKSWLNSAGFPTEQCLLPMVRARARINNDGEASGTFWLYARCTFQ